jgi:lipopolysaccharide transport protein LptA/LPS export ABC transporter protein LptC
MRPPGTRLLRRGLALLILLVAGAVGWNLWGPSATPSPSPVPPAPPGEGTTIGNLVFFRFHAGEQQLELKARAASGEEGGERRFEGVEVTFPYTARGEKSSATITADRCLYDARRERSRFRGHVHLITADGFELRTESLDYLGDAGRVVGNEDVAFRRAHTSGTAHGFEYDTRRQDLVLRKDVRLVFEHEQGPPTEVSAGHAEGSRATRVVELRGGVTVREGSQELSSNRLKATLDPELESIVHLVAISSVDLRTGAKGSLGGDALPPGGERRLQCRRLDVDFQRPGVPGVAVAQQNVTLEILPGPKEPPERRTIQAGLLRFRFDEEGRLAELEGPRSRPGRRRRAQPIDLVSEPVSPGKGGARRLRCGQFVAGLDPGAGTLREAHFQDDVTYRGEGRRAWADDVVYDEKAASLTLSGGAPRIQDEAEHSELRAERIVVGTDDHHVAASGGVHHTLQAARPGKGGLLGGSEPAVLVSREFRYDSVAKTARYEGNALLRSGKDEIRAPLIVIEEPGPDRRRLSASGGVVSLFHPRRGEVDAKGDAKGDAKEAEPVQTRSQKMVYDEKAHHVVYTGDVEIRQGDILTVSPGAVVTLTGDGEDVERIVAGEPVEVRQGQRQATGRTGTYTPANETFVLVGDEVALRDKDRVVRGRALTFQVGNDRIRVDGQEEARTEAIFHQTDVPRP